ncbi:hypothetical protein NBRC110019_26330 [Neptunitalea chrysea]|uniref:Uncharacterized protein n=1 Tax=Neptunitalea chrysea TaxID=1647581 RepID=A0A9W6B8K0_9FLAO|nr:hypothetical protein [Neptunitalea chrysea]GLB53592.1 hypothetical protein NBRC110019_26330 [Neptunitalea chrysea]
MARFCIANTTCTGGDLWANSEEPDLAEAYNTEIPLRLKRDKTAYRLLNTKNGGSFEKVYSGIYTEQ